MAGRVGSRAGIAAGLAVVSIVAGIMSGASATAAGMRPADVAPAPEPTIQPGRPGGPPVAPPPTADPAPTATPTPTADPAPTATPTPIASVRVHPVAPPADLAVVRVASTLGTVYPLATGYHDRARFVLQAVTADRHAVAVTGVAVLRLGGRVVKTWTVRAAGPSLDWDGRIGGRVVPGLYRLTARVHEPGRPDHAASARVRISAKHFALGTAAIEAPAARTGAASRMPDRAARAFRYGRVRVRISTDATVRGAAELLFVSRAGTVALPLADGLHTTASLTVPDGVTRFTVYTRWAPGAVHLHSLRVRWTYRRLVD